jgi:hypothetical protein
MAAKRGPREEESVLRVDGREYVCYVFVTQKEASLRSPRFSSSSKTVFHGPRCFGSTPLFPGL